VTWTVVQFMLWPDVCPSVNTGVLCHNDTTLSELVQPKQSETNMSTYLADLLTWVAHNGMEINTSKTK